MANKLTALVGLNKPSGNSMPVNTNRDMKYEAHEALHTIHRAEEHRKDRELMKHVKRLAKDQAKAVC
jgi:hypothetical protein